jgi:hypothetical protein
MHRHRSILPRFIVGLVLACLLSAPATAQDLLKQVPSLKWIPANAGSYSAMLRNREQLDILLQSKAFATLMKMPGVQMLKQQLEMEWANDFGPFGEFRKWYEQPGNAELVEIAKDLVSDEIFLYADHNTAEFVALLQDVYYSGQFGKMAMLIKDGPIGLGGDPLSQIRLMLQSLADNADRLKFPDMVVGFRLTKTKPANLAKLIDGALGKIAKALPPPFNALLKKKMIHGSEVHALTLNGSMVPWDFVPWQNLEDAPGQFDKLRKKLKEIQITIAICVRDNYLLVSVGDDTAGLQALGAPGAKLIDRPELAPLAKAADRRLVSLSYVSKESLNAGSGINVDESMKWIDSVLKDANLTAEQQRKIKRDFKNLLTDFKRYVPDVGAHLDFTFLNGRGYEGFAHNYSKNQGLDGSKPLTILNQVGGTPIGFLADRSPSQTNGYKDLVKYIKLAHEYVEEFAVPEMPEEVKAIYQQFMTKAVPYFVRLDKATGDKLLPSLDGQGAVVLDMKLKLNLPNVNQMMPVPELGVVTGLNNAKLFREAMAEYRDVFNGLVDVVTKLAPPGANVPDFKMPEPKVSRFMLPQTGKKGASVGTLYSWPLPELPGLDPKIMPTGGVSEKFAVFALSQGHAKRMLGPAQFKMDGGPLGDLKKPLASAAHFNWAALVDAVTPWADFVVEQSGQGQDVRDQVHTVLQVLKCFRTFSSATYMENNAVVTHHETVFRDLEK